MHTALEQYKFTSERVNYVRAIILLYLTNYQATSTHTHTKHGDDSMQFYSGRKKEAHQMREREEKTRKNSKE